LDQQVRPDGLTIPDWLLSPEHAAQMGGALWVFLWLWREGAAGDSPFVRDVRGGAVVEVEEISAALGLPKRSVERHLATLREAGYLQTFKERYGFTALVSLWDSARSVPPNLAELNQSSPAKNGGTEPILHPEPPKMAGLEPTSPAKNGGTGNPPGPPLKEQELLLNNLVSEGSSVPDPGFLLRTSSSKKKASVVPIRPGVEGEPPPSGPGIAAAVAAGPSPRRLRHEQAILHHLGRIEAWERPELTATLSDALMAVPLEHLAEVFELCWRKHRLRNKALENPAGWWAMMLRQTAEVVAKAVAQSSGFS